MGSTIPNMQAIGASESFNTNLASSIFFCAFTGWSISLLLRSEAAELLQLTAFFLILPAGWAAILHQGLQGSLLEAALVAFSIYYCSLSLSVLQYRLSGRHPLSAYPGPLLCKISKLWLVYVTSQGRLHEYFKQVHDVYGPIVRIGPNELSIVDADLLPWIMGADGMPKGPLWEGRRISGKKGAGAKNAKGHLIGARNKELHAESRRTWNRAFTTAAVKDYEPIMIRRAAQLVEELRMRCAEQQRNEAQVDLSQWLSYFTFDFMGDMVFGGGFELMHEGDRDGMYQTMVSGLYLPALTQQIPWCARALPYLPFVGKHMKALGQFAFKQITRRLQEGSVQNDLFYHLLDEKPEDGKPTPFPVIMTNAVTAMLAGSDTTAVALCNAAYYLLSNPACLAHLREEVDATFPPGKGEPVDAAKLASMEYLNACINEALRLLPPIPTSLQRAPTPGSSSHQISPQLVIGEGTAVLVPPYVIQRDPRYFSPEPDRFWPERWLADRDPSVVLNTNAYIPFSTGPANCVGRPVALLALRMVLAYLVQRFEMRLADGYDQKRWGDELRDFFAFQKGALPVVLVPRY